MSFASLHQMCRRAGLVCISVYEMAMLVSDMLYSVIGGIVSAAGYASFAIKLTQ